MVHSANGFQCNNHCLQVASLVEGVVIGVADVLQFFLGFVQSVLDALGNDLAIVGNEEGQADTQAPAETGAAGTTAFALIGPGRTQNTGLDEGPESFIVIEAALPLVHLAVLLLPEIIIGTENGTVLIRNGVLTVFYNGVQVIVIPEGTPHGGFQSIGLCCHITDNQLIIINIQRSLVKIVRGGMGPFQYRGQTLMPFPGLDDHAVFFGAEHELLFAF